MNPRDYTRIGRQLALILLAAAPIFAQCPTGTAYPAALDTNATLTVAKNNLTTTLTVNQQVADTVAIVASTTGFVANMMIAVDSGASTEYEFVGSVSGANTLNVTRACDNSTAVVHLSGVSVVNIISAYSGHTSVTSPITAIETLIKANPTAHNIPVAEGTSPFTYLPPGASGQVLTSNGASADPSFTALSGVLPAGTQLQTLRLQPNTGNNTTLQFATPPVANPADYNFPSYSCNGSAVCTQGGTNGLALVIGNNSLTMNPVPLGTNGSDTGHFMYVSGGVGTAEACLITGGAGTSGQSSGVIIINCANTHSGAWTVQSASSGIQEALNSQGGGRVVVTISPGTTQTFGQITMPANSTLGCNAPGEIFVSGAASPGPCLLTFNQTTGTVIKATQNGDVLVGLAIGPPGAYGATPQNVTGVDFTGAVGVKIISCAIYGTFIGVNFNTVNVGTARDVYIVNAFTNGIGFNIVSADDILIEGSQANGVPVVGAMKYSVFISDSASPAGGGVQLANNDFFESQFGIFIQSTTANGHSQVLSSNDFFNKCQTTCIAATATTPGFARSIQIVNPNIEVSAGDGIQIGGSTGNVDSVTITGGSINNNGKNGIHLSSGALHTSITGVKLAQNSASSAGTFSGLGVDAGVSQWTVAGGWFGPADGSPTEPAQQAYAVNIAAGASDNYSITGVYVGGNATGTINDLGTGTHKVITNNLGALSTTQTAASATGQTAALAPANLLCNGAQCAAGQYLICFYFGITATGTGNGFVNIQWNDGAATQTFSQAAVSAAALNFGQGCLSVRSAGSTQLIWSTNFTATGTYQVYVSVTRQQ